ncbi:hypothetical protein, partial [Acinetobacter pittii]|uniref:hypothetical protein n=1 Tax=Acinetobacter pittii TaxID=48296 RepID=UPI001BDBA1F7
MSDGHDEKKKAMIPPGGRAIVGTARPMAAPIGASGLGGIAGKPVIESSGVPIAKRGPEASSPSAAGAARG